MSKNKDLLQILSLVLIGMFLPFLGSTAITYGWNIMKIASTFIFFLLIFGAELAIVYVYFTIGNKIALQKIEKYKK